MWGAAPALAQGVGGASLERQTEDAFRQLMQQPADISKWTQYARLLVEAGNFEGGIAALERLVLQPNAPAELNLELGVLYFRLESYLMAQSYLEIALADTRLSAEQKDLAQKLLADAKQKNQVSQFSGFAQIGLRHQSNPTYRTGDTLVFSGGALVPLPANLRPQSDSDLEVTARGQHRYDLGLQNSAAITTNFGVYLNKFRSSSGSTLVAANPRPYNLALLDLDSGVTFKPNAAGAPGLTLRPHVLLSQLYAQQHKYVSTAGMGLTAAYRADEKTLFELTADSRRRSFAQRIDAAAPALTNGRLSSLQGRMVRDLGAGRALTADLAYRKATAGRAELAFKQTEVRVSYALSYSSPVQALPGLWSTTLWLGGLRRSYGGPDAILNAAVTRTDKEWRVGVSQFVPLSGPWSAVVFVEHIRNRASLPNFNYRNNVVSGAIVRSF